MDYKDHVAGQESSTNAVFSEEAEEVWHVNQDPQQLLRLHCGSHPNQLHHRVVREHYSHGPQMPAESGQDC